VIRPRLASCTLLARGNRTRSSGRYLFDALVSVGHDFGIEIDGFRPPGI
jgi:hypothetical protein